MEFNLKALANRRRLAIITFVKIKREVTVGEIAEEIKLSFRSTSKHLGILAAAGILEKKQRSAQVHYFWAAIFQSLLVVLLPFFKSS